VKPAREAARADASPPQQLHFACPIRFGVDRRNRHLHCNSRLAQESNSR
jgi:hypothetical protein